MSTIKWVEVEGRNDPGETYQHYHPAFLRDTMRFGRWRKDRQCWQYDPSVETSMVGISNAKMLAHLLKGELTDFPKEFLRVKAVEGGSVVATFDYTSSEAELDKLASFDTESISDGIVSELAGKPEEKPAEPETPMEVGAFIPPSWEPRLRRYLARHTVSIVISGPAGNGKTTGAKAILEDMGFRVYEYDCTASTFELQLIGRDTLSSDGNGGTYTQWTDGIVTAAARDEMGALLLNEIDALTPESFLLMQSILQSTNRAVRLPHETVVPTGKFPILMTANTVGNGATRAYNGRNALDAASMDRVEVINTTYENTLAILVSGGVSAKWAYHLDKWALAARKRLDEATVRIPLSNRRLMSLGFDLDAGLDFRTAYMDAFGDRLSGFKELNDELSSNEFIMSALR